jgi:fumarate hydratase class II
MPREMIVAYAMLKKAAATANFLGNRLGDQLHRLIVQACDELLAGQWQEMFPLHVWMTGSGTQFNMNVNEVVSNRCCQLAGTPLGSKAPPYCSTPSSISTAPGEKTLSDREAVHINCFVSLALLKASLLARAALHFENESRLFHKSRAGRSN